MKEEQRGLNMGPSPHRWTFFASMYGALREKERRKTRLAKCPTCRCVRFYKLVQLDETATTVQCRKCGTKIPI